MGMTVNKRSDDRAKKVIVHRVADIPGGVGIKTADLGGDYLFEGTPLGAPKDGLCSVVKYAKVVTAVAEDATVIEVEKNHHFKVGDVVAAGEKTAAYPITNIDKASKTKDVITVGTTLGEIIAVGGYIVEASTEASTATSELKVLPVCINGTNAPVKANDNLFADAWAIAVTQGNDLPACIADKLKQVTNI